MHFDSETIPSIIKSVAGVIIVAVIYWVAKKVREFFRPKISRDTETDLRQTLSVVEIIFHQARNAGGHLGHPWNVDGEKREEHKLRANLEANKARVGDRRLSPEINLITQSLRSIFATAHSMPQHLVESMEGRTSARANQTTRTPNPAIADWYAVNENRARKMLESANTGIDSVQKAISRLDKLSKGL